MRRLGSHGFDGVHILGVCFMLAVSFLPGVPCRAQLRLPPSVSMGHLHETQQMCEVMSMNMPGSVTLCAPKAPSPIGWKEVTGPAHTSGELIPRSRELWRWSAACFFSLPSTNSHIKCHLCPPSTLQLFTVMSGCLQRSPGDQKGIQWCVALTQV